MYEPLNERVIYTQYPPMPSDTVAMYRTNSAV